MLLDRERGGVCFNKYDSQFFNNISDPCIYESKYQVISCYTLFGPPPAIFEHAESWTCGHSARPPRLSQPQRSAQKLSQPSLSLTLYNRNIVNQVEKYWLCITLIHKSVQPDGPNYSNKINNITSSIQKLGKHLTALMLAFSSISTVCFSFGVFT